MKRTADGFDKTQLSIDKALSMNQVHRDYITHCFRWSFGLNYAHLGRMKTILDFGCGERVPFLDTIFSSRRGDTKVAKYVGVDLNPINPDKRRMGTIGNPKFDVRLLEETNILDVKKEDVGNINTVVSFEVFEHCPPEAVEPILRHLHSLADSDAHFIYSTPVFNGKAAKNHVNEMSRDCFGWLLEKTGHEVVENYGTFASKVDYKSHLSPSELEVFTALEKYHSVEVISNFLAPLYPGYSRNNLWVLKKADENTERQFPDPGPHPRSQNGEWDND